MSDVFGEARIRILPDLTEFRSRLNTELATALAAQSKAMQGTSASAQRMAGANALATRASANLAKQSGQTTAAMLGAGTASARLDAALLGLRTAAGQAAVIGLGATALAAIAAGKAFRQMVIDTAAFEQELATFQATTGATADEMEAVSAAAQRLGADVHLPAVSASDAAVAMTELSKAGLSVQESIAGAEGVLQLATAAQISNAAAAQLAASALNAFGLSGDQATRVADDLANAANAAQGSISDFGAALQQSEAVARQVGLSLEDTTALLSLFAKNGLTGSDAGTSLRVALIRLVAPTDKAAAEIKKLGLNIRDAAGNVRADVFAQFGEATANLSPAMRDAAAALIFGQDAIRAVAIGSREGTDGLRLMQFQIDQSGTAAKVAASRTVGLAGAFSALQSNAQTTGIALGQKLAPALTAVADAADKTITAIGFTIEELDALNKKIDDFFTGLPGGKTGKGFAETILGISGIDVTNAGLALVGLGKSGDKAKEKLAALQDQLEGLQQARISAERGGATGVADNLTEQIERLKKQIDDLKTDIRGVDATPVSELADAAKKLQEVRDIRIKAGLDTTNIDAALRGVDRQLDQLDSGTRQALVGTGKLSGGLNNVAAAADNAAAALARAQAQVKGLTHESAALGDELLKLQSEGGTPQQQIAVLRQDIAKQRAIVNTQLATPSGTPGRATAIRAAREKIIQDQAEVDSLLSGIESDQKAAEDKAKASADKITKAREEADKAILKIFGIKEGRAENKLLLAASTESLADDIKANVLLRRILRKQINAAKTRIKDLETRRDFIREQQQRIIEITNTIIQERKDFADQLAKETQERQDRIVEGIELDIELAHTNENVQREITLREKLIAALKKQQAQVKKGTVEWKRLRNRIAEEREAIEELKKETEKRNQTSSTFFEFLQAQQGFAANLLGNLVPLGALSGTVGGSLPFGGGGGGGVGGGGSFTISSAGGGGISVGASIQQQAAAKASHDQGGFTGSQPATVIELLRGIVRELQAIRTGSAHPHAAYHKKAMSGGSKAQAQ